MDTHPSSMQALTRTWNGVLAHYHHHDHQEHLEALVDEISRWLKSRVIPRLDPNSSWGPAPLGRLVVMVGFLIDQGVLLRQRTGGRITWDVVGDIIPWASRQEILAPHIPALMELLAILQSFHHLAPSPLPRP